MSFGFRMWFMALAASLIVHTSVASLFSKKSEDVKIAGGQAVEIALLGQSTVDQLVAGEITETQHDVVEPVPDNAAVEPTPVETQAAVEPVESVQQMLPDVTNVEEPQTTVETQTASGTVQSSVADVEMSEQPDAQANAAFVDSVVPENAVEAIVALQSQPVAEPTHNRQVLAPIPERVSTPVQRPKEVKKVQQKPNKAVLKKTAVKKTVVRKKTKKARKTVRKSKRKKVAKKTSGQKGTQKQAKRKGVSTGKKKGRGRKDKNKSKRIASVSGNASISNYKGKLRRKINRRFRPGRVRDAKRDAVVRFVVMRSGRVSSVRLARSSGSSKLDSAALKAVRRAAPFAAFPKGYSRSSLTVTVPMNVRG